MKPKRSFGRSIGIQLFSKVLLEISFFLMPIKINFQDSNRLANSLKKVRQQTVIQTVWLSSHTRLFVLSWLIYIRVILSLLMNIFL